MQRFAAAAVLALTAATLVACSSQDPPGAGRTAQETDADANALGHVHGPGVDPSDGTLYVASHHGVFRVQDGELERTADRQQDTMGFAVIGPRHFLGSGHPDPTENGETNWQQAGTLDGQVEALDAAPGRWHAATATGVYESTDDGANWTLVLEQSH